MDIDNTVGGVAIESTQLLESGRRDQDLVYAQVHVNRAVFSMNERENGNRLDVDVSDAAICTHIEEALKSLKSALAGYRVQLDLFDSNAANEPRNEVE